MNKHNEVADKNNQLQQQKSSKQHQPKQQQADFYKEFYEMATAMYPAFDVNIKDEMSAIPMNYKQSISDVLDYVLFDLVKKAVSVTDHINHIIFMNGAISAINKIKKHMEIPTKSDNGKYDLITRKQTIKKP
jgi:hypothetical protein